MPSDSQHRIHRHPAAPWAELRVSVNTRDCYRAHAHAEFSVGIVDTGCATFHHPGGPQQVQAGSVVLIEPDVVHSCNPRPGNIWSYRMLFINADWLRHAVAQIRGMAAPPDGLEWISRSLRDPAITRCVDLLCRPVTSEAAAHALAADLPRWVASQSRPGHPRDWAHVPEELVPAMAAMQAGYEKRVTVQELAEACGMSSSQFIRRFQTACDMTPGSYLQNLRVNGARRLLSQGMALADAAQSMGFSDQAHLQRAFKAHHAMTPGNYRNGRS